MNTFATFATPSIARTFASDRTARYEHAARIRRLVRRADREHAPQGRDPDVRPVLVAPPAATGATRSTSTASSPLASLPVDRVA